MYVWFVYLRGLYIIGMGIHSGLYFSLYKMCSTLVLWIHKTCVMVDLIVLLCMKYTGELEIIFVVQ